MSETNRSHNGGFYDSICTCSKCGHKIAKDCFKMKCNCCRSPQHSMVMDGIEGFEQKKTE
ncbi:MAG: hypothetical protein E6L01_01700 [Thaumarchaeota archaeon]|nr:MAG: hypothetical protein E6L01_01700 [Nitrososphaerota archaeon]